MAHIHNPAILILTETKASGAREKRIANRLPFDGAIFANAIGLSGGLWLLWDSSRVSVIELATTEQEIHALVTPIYSNTSWLLSVVYASPRFVERCLLWDNLKIVSETFVELYDFKTVLTPVG